MIWIIGSAIEFGVWIGWLGTKLGSRARIHARLIEGTNAQKTIPFLEARLAKEHKATDKWDRLAAKNIVKAIRSISQYHAFEMLVAYLIHMKRLGAPTKIRICLP